MSLEKCVIRRIPSLVLVVPFVFIACTGGQPAPRAATQQSVLADPTGVAAVLLQNLLRNDVTSALAMYASPEQTPQRRAQIENWAAGLAGCVGSRVDFSQGQAGAQSVAATFTPPCGSKALAFPEAGGEAIAQCRIQVQEADGQLRPASMSCVDVRGN